MIEYHTLPWPRQTLASSLAPSTVNQTDVLARSRKVALSCCPHAAEYSSLVHPVLCPASSP
jgi:hypothetical protein